MNFKTIGIKAAVATAVVAGSAITISPAQAAGLTGTLLINSGAPNAVNGVSASGVDYNNTPNFFSVAAGSTLTGTSFGQGVTIKDLTNPVTTPITDFIKISGGPSFTLTGLSGVSYQDFSSFLDSGSGTFTATVSGFFTATGFTNTPVLPTNILFGLKAGSTSSATFSLAAAATPVPTPALLPGLLALGTGVLRRRKAEATEEVKADA